MTEKAVVEVERRSDKCLNLLHETAKEITLGVSFDKCLAVAPRISEVMFKHLQNVIIENVTSDINCGFEEMKIAEKMEVIDKLAKETPSDNVPWRPVTGIVDISAIEEWGLTLRKTKLKKKLIHLKEKREKLKQMILDKRKIIQQHDEEVKNVLNSK